MNFESLLERFEARRSGAGFMGKCPAHQDGTASLSITQKNGKVLLHCHAGCTTENVLAGAGLTWDDLSPEPKVVATYDYHDETGEVLFQVLRYEPKNFKQRKPDGTWNLNGVRRVPFNLPQVLTAESLLVVEGEKDCLTAEKFGLVATCNPGGAGKWKNEFSEILRGKHVTIIPDGDDPGRKHAEQVAVSLQGKAASVAICNLPGTIKDLSEWPLSRESLIDLIKRAPAWTPTKPNRLASFSTAELFAATQKQIDWLAYPFAAQGLATIVDGLPKLAGKTRFYLEAIKASQDKRLFLNYPTRPMRTVYVSEQSAASLAMQAREVGFTGEEPVEELRWITREQWPSFVFMELLEHLETDVLKDGGYNMLVMDTWHTIARLEDENAASEVNAAGNATLNIATRNDLALSISRHDRKSGGDVGVSGRSSIQLTGLVDGILHLTRVPDHPSQRKLQTISRVPGLPPEIIIDLVNGDYLNLGEPATQTIDRQAQVNAWYADDSNLTSREIVTRFANMSPAHVVSERQARRYLAQAKANI